MSQDICLLDRDMIAGTMAKPYRGFPWVIFLFLYVDHFSANQTSSKRRFIQWLGWGSSLRMRAERTSSRFVHSPWIRQTFFKMRLSISLTSW
jgi:hypothetical protein